MLHSLLIFACQGGFHEGIDLGARGPKSGWFAFFEMMNLLPIDLYLVLVLVVPLGVCFGKWRYGIKWPVAAIVCGALSWIYFNLWMLEFDPPGNGFAQVFYLISGWFWLLPAFIGFLFVFRCAERRLSRELQQKIGSLGFMLCFLVTVGVVGWNLFGAMGEQRAVAEARQQLEKRGLEPIGRALPEYEDGHWIVRYPDTSFKEIRLTRNGRMSWIGGPG